jgi:hypothetical protein
MEDTRGKWHQKLINRLDTKINLKFQLIPCSNTFSQLPYQSVNAVHGKNSSLFYELHNKQMNILCGQKVEFCVAEAGLHTETTRL